MTMFTPRVSKDSGERLSIDLTPTSWEIVDQWRVGLAVLIAVDGTSYVAVRTDCGIPGCMCDAYIERSFTPAGPEAVAEQIMREDKDVLRRLSKS